MKCKCDCGTVKVVNLQTVREGISKSCGCVRVDRAIHGMWKSVEYRTWAHMNYRCSPTRKTDPSWRNYGGRGIRVCKEWRESFVAFFKDVGCRPSAKHSLDRIDNEKGYKPGNVRWATASEQRANKRKSIWERTILLLGVKAGLDPENIQAKVRDGMSDAELARWIARVYKPVCV